MSDLYTKRFGELHAQLDTLLASQKQVYDEYLGRSKLEIEHDALLEWTVKARNLIANGCGAESEHLRAFTKNENTGMYGTYLGTLKSLKAVFLAAKEDYEGGYLKNIRELIRAELFDSELDQARALLGAGYFNAAAVVAGVVLETSIRSLCDSAGVTPGKVEKMNADLVKAGTYNVLVQKRITAMAAIRNAAAHGKTEEFSADDVAQLIEEVERFVASYV